MANTNSEKNVQNVAHAVSEYQATSRIVISRTLPFLSRSDVPAEIKLFLVVTIILVLSNGGALVVLLADVMVSLLGHEIHSAYYLGFLGSTLLILLVTLMIGTRPAQQFENTEKLKVRLDAVRQVRTARRKAVE